MRILLYTSLLFFFWQGRAIDNKKDQPSEAEKTKEDTIRKQESITLQPEFKNYYNITEKSNIKFYKEYINKYQVVFFKDIDLSSTPVKSYQYKNTLNKKNITKKKKEEEIERVIYEEGKIKNSSKNDDIKQSEQVVVGGGSGGFLPPEEGESEDGEGEDGNEGDGRNAIMPLAPEDPEKPMCSDSETVQELTQSDLYQGLAKNVYDNFQNNIESSQDYEALQRCLYDFCKDKNNGFTDAKIAQKLDSYKTNETEQLALEISILYLCRNDIINYLKYGLKADGGILFPKDYFGYLADLSKNEEKYRQYVKQRGDTEALRILEEIDKYHQGHVKAFEEICPNCGIIDSFTEQELKKEMDNNLNFSLDPDEQIEEEDQKFIEDFVESEGIEMPDDQREDLTVF